MKLQFLNQRKLYLIKYENYFKIDYFLNELILRK